MGICTHVHTQPLPKIRICSVGEISNARTLNNWRIILGQAVSQLGSPPPGSLPTLLPHIDLALLACRPSTSPLFSPHLFSLPASLWVQPYRTLKQTLSQYFVQSFCLRGTSLSALHHLLFLSPLHSLHLSGSISPVSLL